MPDISKAYTPYKTKRMQMKNRFIRGAANSFLGNTDGTLSERDFEIYQDLMDQGVGSIITGHAFVDEKHGRASDRQASFADDKVIPQYQRLAEMACKTDTRMIGQINHCGGRSTAIDDLISPSAMEMVKGEPSRAMTLEEIDELVTYFADAAQRVQKAGLDAVEVHAAHLYLLSQFLTPTHNHRTDEYGGSAENRFRVLRRIIEAIHQRCGDDFPVWVKINANAPENDDAYWEDLQYYIKEMDKLDVEAVKISGHDFLLKKKGERLFYLDRTAKLNAMVDMPVVAIGGITDADDIAAVLEAGVELVGVCRALITQSDFLDRARSGETSRCIHCNQCFKVPYTKNKTCVFHEDR